jgi:rhamnosyltransferase
MSKVCAIVVCYHPSKTELVRLVEALEKQTLSIFVINNGGIPEQVLKKIIHLPKVDVVDMGGNLGIAAALNRGFSEAEKYGFDFCVTFDQDSQPSSDHVPMLISAWHRLNSESGGRSKLGAMGASFFDSRNGRFDYPFFRARGLSVQRIYASSNEILPPVDALITSGMLVPVQLWKEFHFDDDLFIDYVDTEWCFRTKHAGFQHHGSFEVKMRHELSDDKPIIIFGMIILRYSALRRYYYFRNGVYLATRNYVPMIFRIRLISGMLIRMITSPIIDPHPTQSLKYIFLGLRDAVFRRFGRLGG